MNCIIAIATLLIINPFSGQLLMNNTSTQNEADSLIKNLWSPDESFRETAKKQLRQLGPTVIQPLMKLLEELKNTSKPIFESGKEAEGEEIYQSLLEAEKNKHSGEAAVYGMKLLDLDITARLREDAIELLGDVRAQEAIPYLITNMERQPILSKLYWCVSMESLVKIGSPAVPQLLESLQALAEKNPKDRDDFAIKRYAMVLAKIGDPRALPVLEKIKPADSTTLDVTPEINRLRKKLSGPQKAAKNMQK